MGIICSFFNMNFHELTTNDHIIEYAKRPHAQPSGYACGRIRFLSYRGYYIVSDIQNIGLGKCLPNEIQRVMII